MPVLFEILVTNAIVAAVLALVVFLVTRMYKNCFAVHFLWLIVLVKLVTPPIWQMPVTVLSAGSDAVNPVAVDTVQPQNPSSHSDAPTVIADSIKVHAVQESPLQDPPTNKAFVDHSESATVVAATPGVDPLPAKTIPGFQLSMATWVAILWASGSLGLLFFTIYRLVSFDRSLRRVTGPDKIWQERVDRLANMIGLSRLPLVRTTSAKISPLIWCVRRKPVLVLPIQLMESLDKNQADQIIVHELAHLVRRSHWIRWFELFVTSVYWWNPVLWWSRNQLHQADEACCDSMVLKHFPDDSYGYGESLLRSAEYLSQNSPQAPLAFNFSHFKFLKRRMKMVLNNELTASLSRKSRFALTVFAGLALVLSARAIAGSNASSVKEVVQETGVTEDSLVVIVVDPTGNPVESASVTTKEGKTEKSFQTDTHGKCNIGYSGAIPKSGLWITVQAKDYVPMKSVWLATYETPLPDSLKFELQRPAKVGGTVVDASGLPIPGVKLQFRAITPSSNDTHMFSTSLSVNLETDQNGRWSCERVPSSELGYVWGGFSSDDHVYVLHQFKQPDWPLLRDQTHKQTLQKGYRVRGRVTDAEGFPVCGAHCIVERSAPVMTTDMNGEYELTGVEPGERYVTMMAEGYAPVMHKVAIVDKNVDLDLKLAAGEQISIELVDPAGNPIADANVHLRDRPSLSRLMYHSPLKTGPDGVMNWKSAPVEAINYRISAEGFSRRTCRLSPRKAPYKLVLYPPLNVKGNIVDKISKAPIKKFKVFPGKKDFRGQMDWSYPAFSGSDGALSWTQKDSEAETYFRIEAEGYVDFVTRGVKQTEGAVELAINLEPAKTRTISLIGPDGKMATQAKVFLGRTRAIHSGLYFRNGAVVDRELRQKKLTVRDGKLEIPVQSTEFNLTVIAKEGYRSIERKELEKSNQIQLLAWSRVEGIARIGAKPAVGETIKLMLFHEHGATIDYSAKVNEDGKFIFTRVPPNLVHPRVYRQIIKFSEGGFTSSASASTLPITLVPGKTTKVELGGSGRAVVGKLIAPDDYDSPIAQWNHGSILLERTITGPGGEVEKEYHGTVIGIDGTFRFEDVPAGHYQFEATIREKSEHRWKDGLVIGSVSKRFVIDPMPGGRSDKSFDLGKLDLR